MDDGMLDIDLQIAEEWTTKAPIPFRLHGQIFKAHGDGPGMVLLDFISASAGNNGLAASKAMLDFLKACMPADEFERFQTMCNDPDIITPIEHLALLVRGLIAEYNKPDRPTVPSSFSSDGSTPTTDGLQDGSPDAATPLAV